MMRVGVCASAPAPPIRPRRSANPTLSLRRDSELVYLDMSHHRLPAASYTIRSSLPPSAALQDPETERRP